MKNRIPRIALSTPHSFPAGDYYIADPCYVIPDSEWESLLDSTGYFGIYDSDKWNDGLFMYGGFYCFAYETKWGDGCYRSGIHCFPVDAGLLSLIPVEAVPIPEKNDFFEIEVFTFKSAFCAYTTTMKNSRTFHFGRIKIVT